MQSPMSAGPLNSVPYPAFGGNAMGPPQQPQTPTASSPPFSSGPPASYTTNSAASPPAQSQASKLKIKLKPSSAS